MQDLMVDIETLGTKYGSVITSIGAVAFDIGEEESDTFYAKIDLQSSLDLGLKIDGDTLKFWMLEKHSSLKEMLEGTKDFIFSMESFSNFVIEHKVNRVWGNSAAFDLGLLSSAFDKIGKKVPWDFWQERCFRTVNALFDFKQENVPSNKNLHHPLFDCHYQIAVLNEIVKSGKFNLGEQK